MNVSMFSIFSDGSILLYIGIALLLISIYVTRSLMTDDEKIDNEDFFWFDINSIGYIFKYPISRILFIIGLIMIIIFIVLHFTQ